MATKKKTEIVEEVQTSEEPVEEAKPTKKTTKKSTAKKVEVPVIEEVKSEPEVEVVGKKVAEVIVEPVIEVPVKVEEPKKEVKKAEPKTSEVYFVQVIASAGVFTFKGPGLDFTKGKIIPKGAKVAIKEVKGNWGKIADDKWILLSSVIKI